MYEQWVKDSGGPESSAGIGNVEGVPCMIIANDAHRKGLVLSFRKRPKKVISPRQRH